MDTDQQSTRPGPKRRPSKACRQRKRAQTYVKYNYIGQQKLEARLAAVNIVHVDDEDVDLSDAFQFMDWYNDYVVRTLDDNAPVPESIVFEFRNNLLSLDLAGKARTEKIQFVMDIVQAPELSEVCRELLSEPDTAVDALDEIPLIDLSEDIDPQPATEGSIDGQSENDLAAAIVEEGETLRDNTPMGFVRDCLNARFCPILMHEEMMRQRFDVPEDEKLSRIAGLVVNWRLRDFMNLFVSSARFNDWILMRQDDRSDILNVRCCYTDHGYTQHRYRQMFIRGGTLVIKERSKWFGLQGITTGIGVVTTGEDGCRLIRV